MSVQYYVPSTPLVSPARTTESQCGFEKTEVSGPGYWTFDCKRTSVPGTKVCKPVRVEKKTQRLQPVKCLTQNMQILKGVGVKTDEITDSQGRVIGTRQTRTPDITTYSIVAPNGSVGQPIEYRNLPFANEPYPVQPERQVTKDDDNWADFKNFPVTDDPNWREGTFGNILTGGSHGSKTSAKGGGGGGGR